MEPDVVPLLDTEDMFQTPYFRVAVDRLRRLVWIIRSQEPYPDYETARDQLQQVNGVIPNSQRHGWSLLIDLREARGRNDPRFEQLIAEHRPALFAGYERRVVLVRTAVGQMQLQRQERETGTTAALYRDFEAAVRYLTGP